MINFLRLKNQCIFKINYQNPAEKRMEKFLAIFGGKLFENNFYRQGLFFIKRIILLKNIFDNDDYFPHVCLRMGNGDKKPIFFQDAGNLRNHIGKKVQSITADHQVK